jgi:plasmid stabilization system protein ParE
MNVVVLPGAELQIRTINGWWRENREAAPDLFAEEVASALDLLARVPRFGQRCRHRTVSGLRRIILRSTRYHIYYAPSTDGQRIFVLAVWSAVRGRRPPIPPPS